MKVNSLSCLVKFVFTKQTCEIAIKEREPESPLTQLAKGFVKKRHLFNFWQNCTIHEHILSTHHLYYLKSFKMDIFIIYMYSENTLHHFNSLD